MPYDPCSGTWYDDEPDEFDEDSGDDFEEGLDDVEFSEQPDQLRDVLHRPVTLEEVLAEFERVSDYADAVEVKLSR